MGVVRSEDKKIEKVMGDKTVKQYWESDPNCIIEYSNDVPQGGYKYVTGEWGVKKNAENPKAHEAVVSY